MPAPGLIESVKRDAERSLFRARNGVKYIAGVGRPQVGLSPKVWCRVQRFQMAVQRLHAGGDVRWAELALDCGFYDQAHFANEFRAFSGIDPTTYSVARGTPWANHVRVD